jgi:hypothetical protein
LLIYAVLFQHKSSRIYHPVFTKGARQMNYEYQLPGYDNSALPSEYKMSFEELSADDYLADQTAQREYEAWLADLEASHDAARAAQEQSLFAQLAQMTDAEKDTWFSAQVELRDARQSHAHYCGDCRAVGLCNNPTCLDCIVNACPDCAPTSLYRPPAAFAAALR